MSSIRTQKDAFVNYEADNYFLRNKDVEYVAQNDVVLKVLQEYGTHPKNVLEVGCSTGYRLHAISTLCGGAKATGIEPSAEAIKQGHADYPEINFIKGTADDMSTLKSGSFDLVVIGFVLYVVDREILFKAVSETDRLLADGGVLMIIDFFSEKPTRRHYQHIQDMQAYAYKQNYEDIFIASKLYHMLDKRSMSHSNKGYDLSDDYHDKYCLVTLRKDLSAGYK